MRQHDAESGAQTVHTGAEHPAEAVLRRFAQGFCDNLEQQQVVRHLLKGCTACSARIRDTLGWSPAAGDVGHDALDHLDHLGDLGDLGDLDGALDRAFARIPALLASGRRDVKLFERLTALTPRRQLALAGTGDFRDVDLARLLLERAAEAMTTCSARGLHLARLAIVSAERLSADDPKQSAEILCEAWQVMADGFRLRGRQRAAAEALERAGAALPPAPSWRLRGLLLRRRAVLLAGRRRLRPAMASSTEALAGYRLAGDRTGAAKCLFERGCCLGHAAQTDEALRSLFESARLADDESELSCVVVDATVRLAAEAGRGQEGLLVLAGSRRQFDAVGRRVGEPWFNWLHGVLAARLRLESAAGIELTEARYGFLQAGRDVEAGLVSLDLGAHLFLTGSGDEWPDLAPRTLTSLRRLGVGRRDLRPALDPDPAHPRQAAAALHTAARRVRSRLLWPLYSLR